MLARVRDEIGREAARERGSGVLDADFEERLDRAFAALSPGEGSDYLLRQALEVVDQRAALATQVPVASRRPGGSLFKRIIRAAVGWYVRFFVGQLTGFAIAVARALHVLADDLEHLRDETSPVLAVVPESLGGQLSRDRWWMPLALAVFSDASAPVLCGDAGDLVTLNALHDAGVGAYAVRDGATPGSAAGSGEVDVRDEGLIDHARTLVAGAIGGALLEGSVERLGPRSADELLGALESAMGEGATLMVVSFTPQAWNRRCDPLVADLAPGRPLHPETWAYLMEAHGFAEPRVHRGGTDLAAQLRVSATAPADRALVTVLDSLSGGPDEYAVIGVRRTGAQ